MAIFFLVASCRPHNTGIGRSTIAVSMTMFTLTERISSTAMSLQDPPGTGFHMKSSVVQLVKKTQINAIPYPETINIKTYAAYLKGLTVKMQMYIQRMESLQKTVAKSHVKPTPSRI